MDTMVFVATELTQFLGLLVGLYLATGLVIAIFFSWRGAAVLDSRAESATWGFRLAIVPASAAIWPYLLKRWVAARKRG